MDVGLFSDPSGEDIDEASPCLGTEGSTKDLEREEHQRLEINTRLVAVS